MLLKKMQFLLDINLTGQHRVAQRVECTVGVPQAAPVSETTTTPRDGPKSSGTCSNALAWKKEA